MHRDEQRAEGWTCVLAVGAAALWLAGAQAQERPLVAIGSPVTYEAVTIPMAEAGRAGLAVMIVTPKLPGQHPLVLMTPGSDLQGKDPAKELRELGPGRLLPEATWFARRGWEVAIVLRRGFGDSGGVLADDFLYRLPYTPATIALVERTNARDLRAAYAALRQRPEVDATRVIAVGNFSGGSAAMWLAEPPQPGPSTEGATPVPLRAVINFSGGWATVPDYKLQGKVHGIPDVVEPSFAALGAATRVPMLWLYPEMGSEFGLKSATAAKLAFNAAGGEAQLQVLTQAVDKETSLFDLDAAEWGPLVERFLDKLGLPSTVVLEEAALPNTSELPDEFKDDAKKGYLQYLRRGPSKAFVWSPHGDWAYATGKASMKVAEKDALKGCGRSDCKVEESVP